MPSFRRDMEEKVESEVSPHLPTSGQILGVLIKSLRLDDYRLRSRTASRYFSGRLDEIVKDSNRTEIIEAFTEALDELGFRANFDPGEEPPTSALTSLLDWHAVHWDRLRIFLLPRMSRVYSNHLAVVWQTYLRLVVVDLAFRLAAFLLLNDRPQDTLDFLESASVDRRGSYLNAKRKVAGIPVLDFAESVGVNNNAVEAWLYRGARPSEANLSKIASVLSSAGGPDEHQKMLRDLRMLYWISDITKISSNHIGVEAAGELVDRLHEIATRIYRMIDGGSEVRFGRTELAELANLGSRSPIAQPLLAQLIRKESDAEWTEDLSAAGSDWIDRVLSVNLRVHRSEEDALIEMTNGQILERWDISNPEAYEHYRRSMELQREGRMLEAMYEVAKAAELDPLDPANHFTLGSVKGAIGLSSDDHTLFKEALDACWMAVSLDPNWILPWTEIGWLLLRAGMTKDAVEHLRRVKPECGPLDARYYYALGLALHQLGDFGGSLDALESSIDLDPNEPRVAADAAIVALQAGKPLKSNKYRKVAYHLGVPKELDRILDLAKAGDTDLPVTDIAMLHAQQMATLDIAVARRPDNVNAYIARAKTCFAVGEDHRAISDLDAVLMLTPDNAGAHVLRGIVYGYMDEYDLVIADMSEAIRIDPDNAEAYYYRGLARGEQDAFELAIADLTEAVRLSLGRGDAYRKRGDCYLYKKVYYSAIADYETAIRFDAEDAASYRGRGAAFRMKGDLDSAIADYDIAVSLNPDDPFAYRFRGDAYLAKRDFARAVVDFNAALKIDRTDEVAYRGRSNARLLSGDPDLAIADFDAAAKCNPSSAFAFQGRGLAREALGDDERAKNDFRRARELGYDDSV